MKKIAVFGSTGSIGNSTLEIAKNTQEMYEIVALSANSNLDALTRQKNQFSVKECFLVNPKHNEISELGRLGISSGKQELMDFVIEGDYDILVNAIVGIAGLEITYEAVKRGKRVALANKESLVTGGSLIMPMISNGIGEIIPVDSEHSAIFQCLDNKTYLSKIYLTASGGPFRGYKREQLTKITKEQALRHPNWSMGNKITIDSSTLANKGLEFIEAKWLFGVSRNKISVLVHPQSIIHSMVEYVDGSIIAHLGKTDMKIPISYALSYPERSSMEDLRVNPLTFSSLTFEEPDADTFTPLKIAIDICDLEQSYSIAYNAANELLVELFLKSKIRFLDIMDILLKIIDNHKSSKITCIEEVNEVDTLTRKIVMEYVRG